MNWNTTSTDMSQYIWCVILNYEELTMTLNIIWLLIFSGRGCHPVKEQSKCLVWRVRCEETMWKLQRGMKIKVQSVCVLISLGAYCRLQQDFEKYLRNYQYISQRESRLLRTETEKNHNLKTNVANWYIRRWSWAFCDYKIQTKWMGEIWTVYYLKLVENLGERKGII
jgi:hypothetical protein